MHAFAVACSMKFDPDKPIETFASDKLGFGMFARGLARAILNYERPSSFVIGISGAWGAGKTSLLNLVKRAIEEDAAGPDDSPKTVILPFSPWLVGNREVLLRDLLPLVGATLHKKIKDKPKNANFKHHLANLDRYAKAVRRIEMGLSIGAIAGGATPVGGKLKLAEKIINQIGELLERNKSVTLDALKQRAAEALEAFGVRVVIVVDDLDRLDPAEVLSVMRLVKATLDLPRVTFLLAYDHAKVCDAIKNCLSVDGNEYLKKIVQLDVNTPDTDSFDLARITAEGLNEIFASMPAAKDARVSEALWNIVRPLALKTPRDITRILNGTAFGVSMLKNECNPADLFVVAALRASRPHTLGWIKSYLDTYFNVAPKAFDREPLILALSREFELACQKDDLEVQSTFDILTAILPGMDRELSGKETLLGSVDNEKASRASREKRLSSENHWRIYFDMISGRQGFTEAWFESFVESAPASPEQNALELVQYSKVVHATGVNAIERVIDRLRAEAQGDKLKPQHRIGLFLTIANAADAIVSAVGPAGFFSVGMDRILVWLARDLLHPLSIEIRGNAVETALEECKSLSWLAYLIRSELFAHGRIGDEQSSQRQILNESWLDRISEIAVARIRAAAESGQLLKDNDFVNPLFAWRDLTGSKWEVMQWVSKTIEDDDCMVRFVLGFKQMVRSSHGDYWKVDPKSIGNFANVNTIIARLQNISLSDGHELRDEAREALSLIEQGGEF